MAPVSKNNLLCFGLFLCFLFITQLSAQTGLKIIQPNGGEFFQSTDSVMIKWLNPNNLKVNLYFSKDDGLSWIDIVSGINGNQYTWKSLPQIESDSLKIKIINADPIKPTVYGFNTGNPQYSSDGKYIVIFNDSFIEIYSTEDYSLINTFFIYNTLNCSINPSKNEILITYRNGDIEVKNFPSGIRTSYLKTGITPAYKAVYSPDNQRIAVLFKDSKINIYKADGFHFIKSVQATDTAYYINWVKGDTIGVISYSNFSTNFTLMDIISGNIIFQEKGITEYTSEVFSISPDMKYFLLAMGNSTLVYSMKELKRITTLSGTKYIDYASVWSKDSKLLYLANVDSTLRVLDTDWFIQRDIFYNTTGYINTLSISPDETNMIFHVRYNHYKIIKPEALILVDSILTPPSKDIKVSISPDNKTLATFGSDSTLRFWDATINEQLLFTETNNESSIVGVEWSPDGRMIAIVKDREIIIKSSDKFNTIKKIDFKSIVPNVIKIFPKIWTSDSKFFSVNYGDTVYFFDSSSWHLIRKFQAYYISLTHNPDTILFQSDQFSMKYYSISSDRVIDSFKTTNWISETKLHPNKNRIYYRDNVSGSLGALAFFDYEAKYISREYDCKCYAINNFVFNDKNEILMVIDTFITGSMHNLALRLVDSNYSVKDQRYFLTIIGPVNKIIWIDNSNRYLYVNNNVTFIDTINIKIESDESDGVFTIGCPKLTVNKIDFGTLFESSSEELLFRNIIQNSSNNQITIDSIKLIGTDMFSYTVIEPSTPVVVDAGVNLDIKIRADYFDRDTSKSILRIFTKCSTYDVGITSIFDLKILSLFPNPTKDAITIQVKCDKMGKYKLKIFDLKGRLAEEKEWELVNTLNNEILKTFKINMSEFAQATYFVFLITPDKVYTDGFVYCK